MKVRRLVITERMFLRLFQDTGEKHIRLVGNALPDDARIIRSGHDPNGVLNLIIESDAFDEVSEGEVIPVHPAPQFVDLYAPVSV